MTTREIKFHCTKCGHLLFTMDIEARIKMESDDSVKALLGVLCFYPKEIEVEFFSPTDEVKIPTCENCKESAIADISSDAREEAQAIVEIVEGLNTSVEDELKNVTKAIQILYNSISLLKDMNATALKEVKKELD